MIIVINLSEVDKLANEVSNLDVSLIGDKAAERGTDGINRRQAVAAAANLDDTVPMILGGEVRCVLNY